jgi:hypothetical protein
MVYVPFAILVVLLLAGLVTVSLGWKRWHPATIAAGWLLLLAAGAFVVLASMRAEREAAWAELVRRYEASTLRLEEALTRGDAGFYKSVGEPTIDSLGTCSLDTLVRSRNAWRRVLTLVESWKGRSWPNTTFSPPDGENPGLLAIDLPNDPDIAAGAILYVFDQAPEGFEGSADEAEGGFVGAFRVEKVEGKEVSIRPLHDTPDNPLLTQDRERWNRPHDLVTVYESLPVDRRAVGTRVERVLEPSLDLSTGRSVSRGETAEATEGDPEVPASPDSDQPPGDVRWASVTFDEDTLWEPENGPAVAFKANDTFPEFPAAEVVRLKAAGVKLRHRWLLPPGVYWAKVTLKQAWRGDEGRKGPDGEPIAHAAGSRLEIPLEMAWNLEADGILSIDERIRRRPLADGATALDGAPSIAVGKSTFVEKADAEGINRIAVSLRRDSDRWEGLRRELEHADAEAQKRREFLKTRRDTIERELAAWKQDAEDAEAMQETLQTREERADSQLQESQSRVTTLSESYRTALQRIAEEIQRRRPR